MKEKLIAKKDIITSVIALLIVLGTAFSQYLSNATLETWDLGKLAMAMGVAVIGYFTGKQL